jgi:hypothetical protein
MFCTMARIRPTILVAAIIWAFGGPLLSAGDSLEERETLRGLKGIYVLIGLDLTIQDAGIATGMLRPDIETRLKRANIRVLPSAELLQNKIREPILIVNFSGTIRLGDVFVYKLELLMHQRARLERDQSIAPVVVPTWSVNRAGSLRAGQADKLRGEVDDAVNDFIEAYRSVNP